MLALAASLLVTSGCTVSCHLKSSGTATPGGTTTGTVTTTLTDPPTCSASIDHIWVTITKIAANTSSNASPSDSGWVTLVDLAENPQQIDLLSLASSSCALTTLGTASGLPPGNYQELLISFLDNSSLSGPSVNNCGVANGFNCVQPHFGSVQELLLSNDLKDGLVIGPSQIEAGGISLLAAQDGNVNINFDACASLILQSSGQYRLKPVLTAGPVSGSGNSISGTVVDSTTQSPISGANVLLERPDINSIDRIFDAGVTASDGSFSFCPVPAGNFDVVVDAAPESGTITVYSATIAFQVPAGTALGTVPLFSEGSGNGSAIPWATIAGQVTSASGIAADISLYPLLDATPSGGSVVHVTVPELSSVFQPVTVTTVALPFTGSACPAGTDCFNYLLTVPAGNPSVGTFSSGAITYAPPAAGNATYSLNAMTTDCSSSNLIPATVGSISVSPATTTQVTNELSFSGCTQPF